MFSVSFSCSFSFSQGDSAYSIAWLEMGNRSAADAQFDLAFTHMDLKHFNVFEEKNYGNFGNLNFITGAGGYLQNFVNGYAGLRYTTEVKRTTTSSIWTLPR